jgi:hypothetical protein
MSRKTSHATPTEATTTAAKPPAMAPDGGHYVRQADGTLVCLSPATAPQLTKAEAAAKAETARSAQTDTEATAR